MSEWISKNYNKFVAILEEDKTKFCYWQLLRVEYLNETFFFRCKFIAVLFFCRNSIWPSFQFIPIEFNSVNYFELWMNRHPIHLHTISHIHHQASTFRNFVLIFNCIGNMKNKDIGERRFNWKYCAFLNHYLTSSEVYIRRIYKISCFFPTLKMQYIVRVVRWDTPIPMDHRLRMSRNSYDII